MHNFMDYLGKVTASSDSRRPISPDVTDLAFLSCDDYYPTAQPSKVDEGFGMGPAFNEVHSPATF